MSIYLSNININASEKKIIKNANAIINQGKVNVIMGPSGAGKTTLLNYLLFYNSTDYTCSGELKLNGKPLTKEIVQKTFGYVTQNDILMPMFTVHETIYYNISMQYDMTHEEINRRTDELITMLELDKCKHNMVGDSEKKGISGGERKRLSIALEISSNVDVLVLDEPTSGLDTYSAFLVIVMLRDLARKGMTVVCTVHQPSSEITSMFDNLILLCDGQVIYNGEYSLSIPYFEHLMSSHNLPSIDHEANPVDVYMKWSYMGFEVADAEADAVYTQHVKRAALMQDNWAKVTTENLTKFMEMDYAITQAVNIDCKERGTLSKQLVLVQYCFSVVYKNYFMLAVRFFQSAFLAVFMVLFYTPLNRTTIGGFYDRFGLAFMLTITTLMTGIFGNIQPMMQEKKIVVKDYKKNLYHPSMYLIAKNIASFPIDIVSFVIMVLIMYFPLDLNLNENWWNVFALAALLVTLTQVAISFSQIFISLGDDSPSIMPFVQVILQPMIFTSGAYANLDSLWFVFGYIKYINPLSYTYSGILINELTDNPMCTDEVMYMQENVCTMESLGIYDLKVSSTLYYLIAFAVGLRLFGYILFGVVVSRKSVY